jgi:hypothetical protein
MNDDDVLCFEMMITIQWILESLIINNRIIIT